MAAAVGPVAAPTEEQLRLAYRKLYRPGWPLSFEAAMAHRTYLVCITGAARTLNRARWADKARRPSLPAVGLPPTPADPPNALARNGRGPYSLAPGPQTQLGAWPGRLGLDYKRLAANDRED